MENLYNKLNQRVVKEIREDERKKVFEDAMKIIHEMDMKEDWDFDVLIEQINKLEKTK